MAIDDEVAGIVVRYEGERGFRFHSASKAYDTLDGHVFVDTGGGRARRPRARAAAPSRDRAPRRSRCTMSSVGRVLRSPWPEPTAR